MLTPPRQVLEERDGYQFADLFVSSGEGHFQFIEELPELARYRALTEAPTVPDPANSLTT